MNRSNYRLPIFVVIAGIFIIIVLSVVYVLTDGGSSNKEKAKVSGTPTPTSTDLKLTDPADLVQDEDLHTMNAIIKGIDLDNAIIIVQERGTSDEHEFTYNGATDIRTTYNRQITATLLKPGDFVTLSYNDGLLLRSIIGSKDVKLYKNILQRTQDDPLKKVTVGDTIYRYGDDLLVLNEGYFVGIDTLRDMDMISIYSVDDYIYMIKVERGHGYFKMVNHSYFVGGTLKVGKYMSCEITEDLYLTLEEGEYNIVVEHEDFIGEATILIERDYTTRLDMSAYTPESAIMGFYMFEITPASALLYIDGVLTPYDKAVELCHGEHWIQAAAGGYTPYTGFIEVGDNIGSMSIMLSPAPSKTPDILYEDDENSGDITSPSDNASSDNVTPGDDNTSDSSGIVDSTSDKGDTLIENDENENSGSGDDTGNTDGNGENSGNGENTDGNSENTDDNSNNSDGSDNSENTGGSVGNNGNNVSIIIFATEDTSVFLDDTYKGIISGGSIKLAATPGAHNVRLVKEGYLTRRYTIYVENDSDNTEFTFPDMVAE
ncbi:MAG: hypothetical protein K6E85_10900 [Lachnospiraceae bacterium]|nr:hypothetical protein [Lachnospiraceae bacterium]